MKDVKILKQKLYTFVIVLDLIVSILFYFIMPIVQSYPPFSEDVQFQKQIEGITHIGQYTIMFFAVSIIHILCMRVLFKKIYKYLNKLYRGETISYEEILRVRKDCINIPYKLYILQLAIIFGLAVTLTLILIKDVITVLKFCLMLFAVTSLIDIVQFIFLQQVLRGVILSTYDVNSQYEKNIGFRMKFSANLILQIIPFLAVSIIIISLIGYAKTTEEKGNANLNYYKAYMDNRDFSNSITIDMLKNTLDTIPLNSEEDYYFIIPPDRKNNYVSKEGVEVTEFFIKYMDNFFDKTQGRIYEFFGTEKQAYAKKIVDKDGKEWYIGFEYYTKDYNLIMYYMLLMLGVVCIYTLLVRILSQNIAKNIVNISESLEQILKEDNITNKTLPIMSNDELGDLSYYYNKIQEKLISQQEIIQKQGQLATLGEIAGGMAHDINTPISAINTALLMLEEQIEDKEQKETLENMKVCTQRIVSIVNSMRNQIRNLGSSQKEWFKVSKVIEDIPIILHNEIKKSGCTLNINIENDIQIYGETNKLGQVLTNIVMNGLQAYGQNNLKGDIDIVVKQEDNNGIIFIKDKAGGIPENIRPYIFKNILTTKGTKGTGIGLYLAYSIIKGVFSGELSFDSKTGGGTIFYINIPTCKPETENEE